MTHHSRMPFLVVFLLFAALSPARTSPGSSTSRLAEILRLPELQSADWQDLFLLAESGDREAQYWLGVLYDRGDLLPLDKAKSNDWLQKSADQGYARAEFSLCEKRAGQDELEGERCVWRAAEDGVSQAQFWLGVFLRDDRFGVTDDQEALRWFRQAAEGGDPDAQVELGSHYEFGEHMEQDYTQAAYWYRRAAEHVPDLGGAGQGRNRLGLLYLDGNGVPRDSVRADMWFILAGADRNIAYAESDMTPAQISQARQLAAEWKKLHPDPAIY